jgi:hypothetical protein
MENCITQQYFKKENFLVDYLILIRMKSLGFWQQFGILAIIWNFDNNLEFGIWNFGKIPKLYFSICQIPNLFQHI